jgi:hypothetical protein
MQGMRSDASFKKISFPLDKPSRWGQFIGTPCGEIQPKKPKKPKKQKKKGKELLFFCVFFWRIVFCWVFLTQQNGVRWAPRKKTKKNNNTAAQNSTKKKKVARCD